MRVKPLPPTQRENRRYLFFCYESIGKVSIAEFGKALRDSARTLFGDVESGRVHLHIVRLEDDWGILRCNAACVLQARASIAAVGNVGNESVACHVLHTSGTLKTGMERFISKKAALNDELERQIVDFGRQIGLQVAVKNVAVDIPEGEKPLKGSHTRIVGRTIFDTSGR